MWTFYCCANTLRVAPWTSGTKFLPRDIHSLGHRWRSLNAFVERVLVIHMLKPLPKGWIRPQHGVAKQEWAGISSAEDHQRWVKPSVAHCLSVWVSNTNQPNKRIKSRVTEGVGKWTTSCARGGWKTGASCLWGDSKHIHIALKCLHCASNSLF